MTKIVLATRNQGKLKELRSLLVDLPVELLSLAEFPEVPEVVEDGQTFADNAIKKAEEVAAATGLITLADDSGLMVDCLGGAPGVYSARFAGVGKSDADNNRKLLEQVSNFPPAQRTAQFRCVVAIAGPGIKTEKVEGDCAGMITLQAQGADGFGYDPLFYLPEYQQTFAQLDLATKNQISHRGKALQKAKAILIKILG